MVLKYFTPRLWQTRIFFLLGSSYNVSSGRENWPSVACMPFLGWVREIIRQQYILLIIYVVWPRLECFLA
jgi:hypothetical protein